MELNLKLHKGFVAKLNKLKEEYGEEFQKLNGVHYSQLNFTDFIDNFIDKEVVADTTIDSNSNSSLKNISSLTKEMVKPFTKLLSFNKIYIEMIKKYGKESADKWLEDEYVGRTYLADAHTASMMPYCYNFDLKDIANKGLFFINGLNAKPANHWDSFNSHIIEFLVYASTQQAGAVGLASYLIEAFWFYKKDIEEGYIANPEKYKKQQFQVFVYNLNQNFVRTNEPAFTNLTLFDREYLVGLFGDKIYRDGKMVIDYVEEIIQFQKDFMEVVSEIREHDIFTFPVLTFSLLYDNNTKKFKDEEFAMWATKHNLKWNDSNFYIGNDITVLSSCCRLANNMEEVNKKQKMNGYVNSIGGSSISIGSIKVNTINFMRVALESKKDKVKFVEILKERTFDVIKLLDVQRSIIKRNIEKGLLPMYSYGLMEMKNQFSTIGVNAVADSIKYMGFIIKDEFGNDKWTDEGVEFLSEVLTLMNQWKEENDFDYSLNIELIPAEQTSVRFCDKDKLLFGEDEVNDYIYANQFIPLKSNTTVDERIKLSAIFDKKFGGGNILHLNVENNLTYDMAWKLLNRLADEGVIYFAFTTKLKRCKNNHSFIGSKCTICGEEAVAEYQRIVGYYTKTSDWSEKRRKESKERKWYTI